MWCFHNLILNGIESCNSDTWIINFFCVHKALVVTLHSNFSVNDRQSDEKSKSKFPIFSSYFISTAESRLDLCSLCLKPHNRSNFSFGKELDISTGGSDFGILICSWYWLSSYSVSYYSFDRAKYRWQDIDPHSSLRQWERTKCQSCNRSR